MPELAHAARLSVLGQLAASIADEVNQPLTAIMAYGKSGKRWLARETPDVPEAINCFDHVVANGSRAADVIARVRALARNTAPKVEPLDVGELVEEAVALVQHQAAATGIVTRQMPLGDLAQVSGDRVQVQQVLVNLILNGMQAMREVEGRDRELRITASPEPGGMVSVAVRDSGTGIAGDDPARIFAPFFTTKSDGMGMGLSICRSVVEEQGGTIGAVNNVDHGATVTFTLPARKAAAMRRDATNDGPDPSTEPPSIDPKGDSHIRVGGIDSILSDGSCLL